ncbi:MAG TPA: DUF3999 family protein [Pseudomonadales bacterium]|nr:DUF3999 family protein [Pseudomonadales bacterium]
MKSMLAVALLALLVPATRAQTETPRPEDFAASFEILVDAGDDAPRIVEVPLDERVYAQASTVALTDLRVVDADGGILPHVLLRPVAPRRRLEVVPFFVHRQAAGGDDRLRVTVTGSGAILSVETAPETTAEAAERPGRFLWLLDLSAVEGRITGLDFDWITEADGTVTPLRIEASDDLANWQPLATEGALVALESDAGTLERGEIGVVPGGAPYLRVVGDGAELPALRSVRAVVTMAADPPERWWRLDGVAETGEGGAVLWRYPLPGALPVHGLRVADPGEPLLFGARVGVPEGSGVRWLTEVLLRDGSPTRLRDGDRFAGAGALLLAPGVGAPAVPVALEVRVLPPQLRFSATGRPPWRLAVGLHGLGALGGPAVTALREPDAALGEPARGRLGALRVEAGAAATQAPTSSVLPFWLALALGVLLLAWMLRRLLAETGGGGPADP